MNKVVTKIISSDLAWKGLRMELSSKELQNIFQQEFEKDKYFDFDLLLNGMYKALNKKIDFKYFLDWCVLVANCLSCTNYKTKSLNNLLENISCFFDGISFSEEWSKKKLFCDIASLKSFNHEFKNKMNKTKNPFETNGVERILTFDHANWTSDSSVMRVIVKDNKNKQFDLKYVDDAFFNYDENINYTFVNKTNFENIFMSFYNENEDWKENHNLKF